VSADELAEAWREKAAAYGLDRNAARGLLGRRASRTVDGNEWRRAGERLLA
jgi:hypothetical protein